MKQEIVARCWVKSAILPPFMGADLNNFFGKETVKMTEKEHKELIGGMMKIPLDAANISTKNIDVPRLASGIRHQFHF